MKFFFLIFIIPYSLFCQNNNDNIEAIYDSLDNVFYFNKIEIEIKNKYNFKIGEIPSYTEKQYKERIEKLASNSPFNYKYNKVVQNYITMYSKRIKSTGTLLSLSELYFPLYEKYLNQFGLPLELKYLSIVESALNPTAKSQCGASGLWQFMYGTGKSYKLEINSYIDERFDPEKETIAACSYLKDLYAIYGKWDLAIAAYNCGPGNVNKGIKKAGGIKDFWAIYDYLPKETQGYVPAFIAASYIIEYHEEHNIQKANSSFLFNDLDYIKLNYKTSIKELSIILKIDYKELKYLNPKYITGLIPGINNIVVVPKEKALEWIDIENLLSGKKNTSKVENNIKTNNLSTKDKSIENHKNVKVEKANTNYFGTTTINKTNTFANKQIEIEEEQKTNNELTNKLINSKSYVCVSNGSFNVINGSEITLRTTEIITINGAEIPKNSIIYTKIEIKKESIIFKTTKAKTLNGEIPLNIITEIFEKNKGKYYIEDGYVIMLKV